MKTEIMCIKDCFSKKGLDISELYPVLKEFNFREENGRYYIDIDRVDELAYIEESIGYSIDITYSKKDKLFTLLILDER